MKRYVLISLVLWTISALLFSGYLFFQTIFPISLKEPLLTPVSINFVTVDVIIGTFSFLMLIIAILFSKKQTQETTYLPKVLTIIFLTIFILIVSILALFFLPAKEAVGNWVKVDGMWICNNTNFEEQSPEFNPALNLFVQLTLNNNNNELYDMYNRNIAKCIKIKPLNVDTDDHEYPFWFDTNQTVEDLSIYVDPFYKEPETVLKVVLLRHVITHIYQYLDEIESNIKIDCIDKEIEAFMSEVDIVSKLNTEERNALSTRLENYLNNSSETDVNYQSYKNVANVINISAESTDSCKTKFDEASDEFSTCYQKSLNDKFRDMVTADPTYKRICEL